MCGIAGIVGENASTHRDALHRMVSSLAQRGPDAEGFYQAPSGLCLLGHRRLSILDLSQHAAQPMVSPDKRFALCYNGECYNYAELREQLRKAGKNIHSTGDTEVLFQMLVQEGKSCLPKLNAMFAFGFWDEEHRQLFLARDRFGQKPLYFSKKGNLLIFASELRAILASGLVERKLNSRALLSYLSYGSVHGPDTIVKDISLLPAGNFLEWESIGEIKKTSFWEPPRQKQDCPQEELRNRFSKAVDRHLVSDVPVGLFLSGGIDSSAIVAAAARMTNEQVHTLSVVFPDLPQYSEHEHAKRIAKITGTNHIEIPINEQIMLELLPQCLDAMDQPTADGFNTFVVSKATREAGVKVVLSGLGGDELFGGYPSFKDVPRLLKIKNTLGQTEKPVSAILRRIGQKTTKISKLSSVLAASKDLLTVYMIRRQVFNNYQIDGILASATFKNSFIRIPLELEVYLRNLIRDRDIYDAIGLLELHSYMGQTLLRDSDIMGMAHGLEIRMPFLDKEFSDCALELPPGVRIPNKFPKAWFVGAMGDWLPLENVRRKKQGFEMPIEKWMVGKLRDDVEHGLKSLSDHLDIFEASAIEAMWTQFLLWPQSIGWAKIWNLYVFFRYMKKNGITA